MLRNLRGYGPRVRAAVHALGEQTAAQMEGQAKQNAPWTDRTGHARQGLFGYVLEDRDGEALRVRLAHSVHYGVYLELANQGRFAILQPTTSAATNDFFSAVRRVVRGR